MPFTLSLYTQYSAKKNFFFWSSDHDIPRKIYNGPAGTTPPRHKKILAGSCQDPVRILAMSCKLNMFLGRILDPNRILAVFIKMINPGMILAGSWQDPGRISGDLIRSWNPGQDPGRILLILARILACGYEFSLYLEAPVGRFPPKLLF